MSMPKKDIHLNDPEAFEKRWLEYTATADTYEEAYLMVEEDYKKVFGKRKYSGYNSFRVARRNRMKRKAVSE